MNFMCCIVLTFMRHYPIFLRYKKEPSEGKLRKSVTGTNQLTSEEQKITAASLYYLNNSHPHYSN